MTRAPAQILVVDDDPAVRAAYSKILRTPEPERSAHEAARAAIFGDEPAAPVPPATDVTIVEHGQAAIDALAARRAEGRSFALAFIDMRMPPGMDGMTTAERLWDLDPDLQIVIATAYSDCPWAELTARSGHSDRLLFLKKPFDPIEAQQLAAALSRKRELVDDLRRRKSELEDRVVERTRELSRALQAAEAAARAKMEFLANMSHEIRTPLTAILGFTELLHDGSLSEAERREHLEIIDRNGDHLLSLVNNVLDLAKLDADQVLLETLPTDLASLLGEVIGSMRTRVADREVQLELAYEGQCPRRILTDPTRLRQILLNLLSNAIKFTARGRVRLRVRTNDSAAEAAPRIAFIVEDSGIGIPAARMAELFRPFTQADSSTSRRFGGTGLGLSISLRFARLMGGDLTVTSEVGIGSAFTLTLPLVALEGWSGDGARAGDGNEETTVAKEPARTPLVGSLRGRILLAEDGVHNQRLLATILRRAGAEVTVANNGQEAVEVALRAQADGTGFDLILMDMQMPVLDGYGATRALRGHGLTTPIVALTAHAMKGDRERCLAEGCDGYETKPVRAQRLVQTCAQHLPH